MRKLNKFIACLLAVVLLCGAFSSVPVTVVATEPSENMSSLSAISAGDSTNLPDPTVSTAGALEFNGHYYKIYDGVCDTWEEAAEYCNKLGGHLATITSAEENEALYSYITSNNYTTAYFGLTDKNSEGVWEWINGEEVVYTNWHSDEPNNDNREDYGMFYWKFSDGTWNDGNFMNGTQSDERVFICEWDNLYAFSSPIKSTLLFEQYQAKYFSSNASLISSGYMTYSEIEDNYTPTQYALVNILSFGWNKNFGFSDDAKIWEAVILDILFKNSAQSSTIESWAKDSLNLSNDLCSFIESNNLASLESSITLDVKNNFSTLLENIEKSEGMSTSQETLSVINKLYSAANTVKDFVDMYSKYIELRKIVDTDIKAFLYQMKKTDTYNSIPAFSRALDRVIENLNASNTDLAGLIIQETASAAIVKKAINEVVGFAVKILLGDKIFGLIDITKNTTIHLMNTICGTGELAQANVYLYMIDRIDDCAKEAFNNAAQICLSSDGQNSYRAVNGGFQFICCLYSYGISTCRNWIDVITTDIISRLESGPYTTVKRPHYDMANYYLNLDHKSSNDEKKEFIEKKCNEDEKYVDTVIKNQPAFARIQWYHDTGADQNESDCLILFQVENPNGSKTMYAQAVTKNTVIKFPTPESKSGYLTPSTWYNDKEYSNPITGTLRAEKNTVFYTKYIRNILFENTSRGGLKIISVKNPNARMLNSELHLNSYKSEKQFLAVVASNQSSVTFDIPAYIDGYEVVEIGDDIFAEYPSVTSVTIPSTVEAISATAFNSCSNLTISGYENSYAQTYANENGLTFIPIVTAVIPGDTNNDGFVNAKDRMTLTRYLAKWSGYEDIDMTAADVNSDGEVNAKDRMILTRHLAKWQGYEILPLK